MPAGKGQEFIALIRRLEDLLSQAPSRELRILGTSGEAQAALEAQWTHHLAAAMVIICLSILENALGAAAWKKHRFHEDEFDVLRCIRDSYVHCGGDLSKTRNKDCLRLVLDFEKMLHSQKVTTSRGDRVAPYYAVANDHVTLRGGTFFRVRSLALGLLEAAGIIVS